MTVPFNYLLLRTVVGIIAISIAGICTWAFYFATDLAFFHSTESTTEVLLPTSISVTFHFGAVVPFAGMLFIVGAFLLGYNGMGKLQFWLAKFAAISAFLIAIFPTSINMDWVRSLPQLLAIVPRECLTLKPEEIICNVYDNDMVSLIHFVSAFLLIAILFVFCVIFFKRALKKLKINPDHKKLKIRAALYLVCAVAMLLSAIYYGLFADRQDPSNPALFYVELICLVAFGVSWLVAGKQLPFIGYDPQTEKAMTLQVDTALADKSDITDETSIKP